MKKEPKIEKFQEIISLVDAATISDGKTKIMTSRLNELIKRMEVFTEDSQKEFSNFAKSVGYDRVYDEYIEQIETSGQDPVDALLEVFFSSDTPSQAMSAKNQAALDTVKFQTERIKILLTEYDAILRDVRDFIVLFGTTVESYDNDINFEGKNMQTIKVSFDELKKKSSELESDFGKAYGRDIPASTRRILYGAN
jgi:hypothetical protein